MLKPTGLINFGFFLGTLSALLLCSHARAVEAAVDAPTAMSTPHIPFATPLDGGAIRVLSIAPRQGMRDLLELAQRVELAQTIVPLWDAGHLGYDPALPETHVAGADSATVERALAEALKSKLDIVLLASCDLDALPEGIQNTIVEKAKSGCGLVVVQCLGGRGPLKAWLDAQTPDEHRAQILNGVALAGTDGWTATGDFIATSVAENGRVVQIVYPDSEAWTHCLAPGRPYPNYSYADYMDDHLALIIKAMRWAGGREATQRIVQLASAMPTGPDEEEIPPGFPDEYVESVRDSMMGGMVRPFRLFLDTPATENYTVDIALRNPVTGMLVLNTMNSPMLKGQSFYDFDLLIGAGNYRCDAILRKDGRVADFFTQEISVDIWPKIDTVDFTKTWLKANDTLELTVDVPPVLGAHRQALIYAQALDTYGRKVAQAGAVLNNEGGKIPIQLNFADLLSPLIRVELFIVEGDQANPGDAMLANLARYVLYFPVRIVSNAWSMGLGAHVAVMGEANAQRMLHQLQKAGVNFYSNLNQLDEMLHGARAGLGYVPMLNMTDAKDSAFEASGEKAEENKQAVLNAWAGGAGRYWLGAHPMFGETEELAYLEKGDTALFGKALQEYYPDLEMLNAAWNRRFILWDGVEPQSRDEVRVTGTYENWMGLRRVLDDGRGAALKAANAFVRGIDQEGRAGTIVREDPLESLGVPWPTLGASCDGTLLESAGDFWQLNLSQMASFKREHSRNALLVRHEWLADNATRANLPWRAALNQVNDLWCPTAFRFASDASPAPFLMPDGKVSGEWQALAANFQSLQFGAGELAMRGAALHDGVALYYSRGSHALNAVAKDLPCDSRESEWAFLRVINATGYRAVWVDEENLRMRLGEIKVLVLPAVRALSDDEVDLLYEFIRGGGNIVADFAPGLYTEFGAKRDQSPLAGVMGVAYDESGTAPLAYRVNDNLPGLQVDSAHQNVSAESKSPNSALQIDLLKKEESHATFLLNHEAGNAAFRKAAGRALPPWAKALREFLADCGVQSRAFRNVGEAFAFDGEAACFALEGARLTVAYAHPEAAGKQIFEPRFDDTAVVYNPATGEAVARPQRSSFPLEPGGGVALCALPYKVNALALSAPEAVPNGERLAYQIEVNAKSDELMTHPVLVELRTLQGRPIASYRQLTWCPQGVGSRFFSIALNDRIGTCKIYARDLLSGVSAETLVQVGDFKRPANVLQGRIGGAE